MNRILMIEDDLDLQEGLSFSFRADGYIMDTAGSIREGKQKLESSSYDCILLDCNLPDGNGFELCRYIRESSDISILMLTARDTELDEVKALELGVDDFMSKPFSVAVLKARLKRLISKKNEIQSMESNGIRLARKECRVYKGETEISLSKMEYKLLTYFMENRNQVLSKEQILEYVWDQDGKFVDENTVSVNIRRLRQKIEENPTEPLVLKTVHGLGYIWKES